jgi:hypothetical protein
MQQSIERPALVTVSLLLDFALLLMRLFKRAEPYTDYFLSCITGLLFFPVLLFFVLSSLWSVTYVLKNRASKAVVLPACLNVVGLILIVSIPFSGIDPQQDFTDKLVERERIVAMIRDGRLPHAVRYDRVTLPAEYRYLSTGGTIEVTEQGHAIEVLFSFYNGFRVGSGFVYRSDDQRPDEYNCGERCRTITKLKEHWFWVDY